LARKEGRKEGRKDYGKEQMGKQYNGDIYKHLFVF
jgi:hypothetical protein